MATLDVVEVQITAFVANLDVLEVQVVVDAVPTATLDVLEVQLTSPLYTAVDAGPDRSVQGLEIVTISPTYSGTAPTDWYYQIVAVTSPAGSQQAVPSVNIVDEGAQATFVAPATYDGVQVVVGVSATNGSTLSEQDQMVVTVFPHIEWDAVGGEWVPSYEDNL